MKPASLTASAAFALAVLHASPLFAQMITPEQQVMRAANRPVIVAAPPIAQGRPYEALIAAHAAANGIPAELVHRVIVRESRYRAGAVGRGGATGLMQIKLATARGMGYRGTAAGLLDPETNLTYGVRYLAGAYRVAGGQHGQAIRHYASGYYYAAKRQRARANAYASTNSAPLLLPAAPLSPAFQSEASVLPPVTQREVRQRRR